MTKKYITKILSSSGIIALAVFAYAVVAKGAENNVQASVTYQACKNTPPSCGEGREVYIVGESNSIPPACIFGCRQMSAGTKLPLPTTIMVRPSSPAISIYTPTPNIVVQEEQQENISPVTSVFRVISNVLASFIQRLFK